LLSAQRPVPADDAAAALRQTGASPLRAGDPRRVGPYAPVALLGSGGMGRVFLARPIDASPPLVALKVIRPEYAQDPMFRRRFEREASVHARLRTPHAPRLSGTGFDDELLWMATEYLPGFDLAQAVREDGALEPAAIWRLTAELGQALADLAVEEIVHRDLKPSNVVLSVRGAHVIDFGIAKAADASAITGTGNRVGTAAYMSPEHLREGRSDTASDVFSLAGTLIYAATGRAPFGEGTGVDVMHRVAFEDPYPDVLAQISAADAELGALLTACLAKEPQRRPTPHELIDTARARALPRAWPQPLGGKLDARQRAYETLHRTPNAGRSSGSASNLPPAPPTPTPDHAPPVAKPPANAESSPAETPARTRRKPWLIALAGTSACALTAAAVLLTHNGPPATDSAKDRGTTADSTTPRGHLTAQVSPGTNSRPHPNTDGAAIEEHHNPTGTAPRPGTSDPAGHPHDNASAPASAPDTTPSPTPTADNPTAPTDTPAWQTQCTYYSGNRPARPGDSGKRVKQIQCILTKRGYSLGNTGINGQYGPDTQTAVETFQTDHGLNPDGTVNHTTWNALRNAT
jgi:serine/threonine protein kinase